MALRFDDAKRTLTCSVHDLLDAAATSGHLRLDVVQSAERRMAAGRTAHQQWQTSREAEDSDYRSEVRLTHSFEVGGWTATVQGRVDGLIQAHGHTIVEEVKSTALDASRLLDSTAADWPRYADQLQIYLWMLAKEQWDAPVGRLVFLSLADGCRHVLGIGLDEERVEALVLGRLRELVRRREQRLGWLTQRRAVKVPDPFDSWRPGQLEIVGQVSDSLTGRRALLVQAPTGLGKTAAVLSAVLRHALANDQQVFWATARNTQQKVVAQTIERLRERGMPLRAVLLTAKDKVCLNDVVACTPERCPYAERYYDKLYEGDVVNGALSSGGGDRGVFEALGRRTVVCPYQLALDVAGEVDVVVGDYNYAFNPDVRLGRWFADTAGDWIVVVDEAHQLVDRARGYASPSVTGRAARAAMALLDAADASYMPFLDLASEIELAVLRAAGSPTGTAKNGEATTTLDAATWRNLAERVDEQGLAYAILEQQRPLVPDGESDAWKDLARSVLRFARVAAEAGPETATVVKTRRGDESIGLLCLDPSTLLRPVIERLGGFVGCSATLSPPRFYRDMLGLDLGRHDRLELPSPFLSANRRIVVASRVSTAWRDRAAHADRTAALLDDLAQAVPGGLALYFPSFAMLDDIVARCRFPGRELLVQRPGMSDEERASWLEQLGRGDRRMVLAAALGGIFAEGIDLPAGALDAVAVIGPALPPVGLERDLLREYHEEHHGDGFLYASLVPGMTKVAQAGGRLFRRPEDRGVVVLVGRRFRRRDLLDLLPRWWRVETPVDPVGEARRFFAEGGDGAS